MLTVDEIRKFLKEGKYTEEELEKIRDELRALAEIVYEVWEKGHEEGEE